MLTFLSSVTFVKNPVFFPLFVIFIIFIVLTPIMHLLYPEYSARVQGIACPQSERRRSLSLSGLFSLLPPFLYH